MKIKKMLTNPYTKATFLTSAPKLKQLPPDLGFEVAFAGRSNAGKSSALNCLTNQKSLARTSKTPGRTQLMNVFSIDEERRLVDLPGYGFAKVPIAIKQEWQKNLIHYLEARECLCGLILVMDCRHPLKELDQTMLEWAIESELPVHLLLTKADKLSRSEMSQTLLKIKKSYDLYSELISAQAFSSTKKEGLEELIVRLNSWLF